MTRVPFGVAIPPSVAVTTTSKVFFSKTALRLVSLRRITESGLLVETIALLWLIQCLNL